MRGTFSSRRPTSVCAVLLCALGAMPLFLSGREARACPPPSFSEYVEYSDLVVVGKVLSTTRQKMVTEGEEWETGIVTVKAETLLKGSVDLAQPVVVSGFDPDPDSPSPETGATLLVIASAGDAKNQFSRIDVRDVSRDDALAAYTSSIRELLSALALPEGEERSRRGTEWAVRAIESEFLRTEAIRDLDRFCLYYGDDETVVDVLDASQRERLVDVMMNETDPDASYAFELANVLGRYHDDRVLAYLQDALARQQESPVSSSPWLMSMISEQMSWRTGQWLANEYPYDGTTVKQRKAIARFVSLMRTREELPEALAAYEAQQAEINSPAADVTYEREQTIREAEEKFQFAPEEAPNE